MVKKIFPKGKKFNENFFSVLIKITGPEASPLLTYVCIVIFMAINKVYQDKTPTFPSWLLKTKHIGIMPKMQMEFKNRQRN